MHEQERSALRRHWIRLLFVLAVLAAPTGAVAAPPQTLERSAKLAAFPPELVHWSPRAGNPVFTASGPGNWDAKIRERGWILRDGDRYHLWYTGYNGERESIKQLGHATSPDGLRWTRSHNNPLSGEHWVEDMMVVKCAGMFYMFAESDQNDFSVMLTSCDGNQWDWQGRLDVRMADGKTPVPEAVGTPTIWIERGKWYLFYERLITAAVRRCRERGTWILRGPMTSFTGRSTRATRLLKITSRAALFCPWAGDIGCTRCTTKWMCSNRATNARAEGVRSPGRR
jgi:hypothetical protein